MARIGSRAHPWLAKAIGLTPTVSGTEMPEEALVGKRRKICCRRKSSDRGRLKELACGMCNTICCALFRPILYPYLYILHYPIPSVYV